MLTKILALSLLIALPSSVWAREESISWPAARTKTLSLTGLTLADAEPKIMNLEGTAFSFKSIEKQTGKSLKLIFQNTKGEQGSLSLNQPNTNSKLNDRKDLQNFKLDSSNISYYPEAYLLQQKDLSCLVSEASLPVCQRGKKKLANAACTKACASMEGTKILLPATLISKKGKNTLSLSLPASNLGNLLQALESLLPNEIKELPQSLKPEEKI